MASVRPTLIICEQAGNWASAIRRLIVPTAPRLRPSLDRAPDGAEDLTDPPMPRVFGAAALDCQIIETRTSEQCLNELAQSPAALVAIELSDFTRAWTLDLLRTAVERFPSARVVVLADRSLRHYEWLTRELGAIHFIASPRELSQLVTIAKRHPDSATTPDAFDASAERSIQEIWRGLPWG